MTNAMPLVLSCLTEKPCSAGKELIRRAVLSLSLLCRGNLLRRALCVSRLRADAMTPCRFGLLPV